MIKIVKIYLLSAIMLSSMFLSSCAKDSESSTASKPLVVTSIGPYQFLLKELAGDHIEILNLSEDSGDPHTMQLTPQQSVQLKNAAVFLSLNPIEEELILKTLGNETKIVEMWQGFPLLTSPHAHDEDEAWDEHFWLGPVAIQTQISAMAKELSALLPDRAEQIEQNKDGLLQRAQELAERLQVELARLQNGKIFTFHSSLAYFAQFFDAEELHIEAQGVELGSKEILELFKDTRSLTFPVLIYSPQFQKDKAKTLALQLGLELVEFDPQKANVFENLEDLTQKLLTHG